MSRDEQSAHLPPALALPFESEMFVAIHALMHQWNDTRFWGDALSIGEDDPGQVGSRVLNRISALGPLRPSRISEIIQTSASNASKVINQLERRGLVERRPDPDDSRASLVALTPKGVDVVRRTFEATDERIRAMLASWTDVEVRLYTELTRRLEQSGRDWMTALRQSAS